MDELGRRRLAPHRDAMRERLAGVVRDAGAESYFPRAEFCTDNGAMIALAGCMRLAAGMQGVGIIQAQANWELGTEV
jgi:N6-L-threonylcarbamoyladenine synthase